jgi:hypothetical protein
MEHHKPAIMAFVVEDPAEYDTSSKGLPDMEDDELFEINLEAVSCIPPPLYWDSYLTSTENALMANCLLPISEVSGAVPIASKDVSSSAVSMASQSCNALSLTGTVNLVMMSEPMPLGELLRLPFMAAIGVPPRQMKA